MEFEDATGGRRIGEAEDQFHIGERHVATRLGRPFDQADSIRTEVFTQAGIDKLFWIIETIKIKVIQV